MYMHDFSPIYSPFLVGGFIALLIPLILMVVLWTIVLKAFALWYAARAGQKWWFVALLVVNSVGILEIVYLLFFRPDAPYKSAVDDIKKPAPPVTPSSPSAL